MSTPILGDATFACCEEPRARIEVHGGPALSDVELLALVLAGPGDTPARMLPLARRLLNAERTLPELAAVVAGASGRPVRGLSAGRAARLAAVVEVAKRISHAAMGESPLLDKPTAVQAYMQPICRLLEVEKFWVLCLNKRNRLMRCVEICSGTVSATMAHPREVYRVAIRENASAIVCVHNHPSGDPSPSTPDVVITKTLREASRTVDIQLVDHIVLGRPEADLVGRGYYSFREAGII